MVNLKSAWFVPLLAAAVLAYPAQEAKRFEKRDESFSTVPSQRFAIFAPKVVIISMFVSEQDVWLEPYCLKNNISIPGLSPLYPYIHCDSDYEVCQVTVGEGGFNAAATTAALVLNPLFDFTKTFFMIAGIAGINPYEGTIGSATFARFARFAVEALGEYPTSLYGTEVFELNADSDTAKIYRALYNYAPANQPSKAVKCDAAASEVWFTGSDLAESFGNFTALMTNGMGHYCATANEDNATLGALLRAALAKLVDFGRIVVMRTASNFDRSPPSTANDAVYGLLYANVGAFDTSLENLVLAGSPFVNDVIKNWEKYNDGRYAPKNYIGDIFGTLGGTPDFGPYGVAN
ncbi:hypothetical protein BZG36_01973 [Bifiguratus adelaidae]|uniref:Purine nucleoside permease n=1 Tax=Bifiguratus adelaidae TaxID=1938954 RepID=A0A261Y429_9FUNG|nr:hypothetical protein BZG36_01973 [Bifiguratus adelaidae]